MNVPFSRDLTRALLTAALIPVCYGSFDWCRPASRAAPAQNLLILSIFGLPSLYLGLCLLYRGATFRVCSKVRREDRLFALPWASDKSQIGLMWLASNMMLGLYFAQSAVLTGTLLFALAAAATVAVAVTLDHPRILFSDSLDDGDLSERVSAIPTPSLLAHQDGIFTYSEAGFGVAQQGITQTAVWTDITSIRAHKQDLLALDRICVEVQLDAFQFEFDDETPGWMKFMEMADQHLSSFNGHWLFDVAFPALQPNPTIIYEKNWATAPPRQDSREGRTS